MVLKRILVKRAFQAKWKVDFAPIALKLVDTNKRVAFDWELEFNRKMGYKIQCGKEKHIVDLNKRTCTCRSWQLTAIPCAHAVCAMFKARENIKNKVDGYYRRATYLKEY